MISSDLIYRYNSLKYFLNKTGKYIKLWSNLVKKKLLLEKFAEKGQWIEYKKFDNLKLKRSLSSL